MANEVTNRFDFNDSKIQLSIFPEKMFRSSSKNLFFFIYYNRLMINKNRYRYTDASSIRGNTITR